MSMYLLMHYSVPSYLFLNRIQGQDWYVLLKQMEGTEQKRLHRKNN